MIMKNKFVSSPRTKAALIAIAACVASPVAMAAIVCNSVTTPLAIPNNIDGVYINLVTGATGTAGGATAGWDVNMYATGTPSGLYFFWPGAPANSFGGVAAGTVYSYLADGATIGPAQTYIVSSGGGGEPPFANYRVTQSGGNLGVRFFNEATAAINYGWIEMSTTATSGFPASITGFCYENTGQAIVAGTTPVALQKFSVE